MSFFKHKYLICYEGNTEKTFAFLLNFEDNPDFIYKVEGQEKKSLQRQFTYIVKHVT